MVQEKMVEEKKVQAKKVQAKKAKDAPATLTKAMLKVTQVKSIIGTRESHRACVRGLGLRRLNQTVEVEDTPAVRGMINKVYYLVKCEA